MDALNHADHMRLANLITDNSDDADLQKKMDQVVELTNSTRDQATVALHDCNYDVEKAVDMILECGHSIVENQWKSAGKKKNKTQASKSASNAASNSVASSNAHQNSSGAGSNRNMGSHNKSSQATSKGDAGQTVNSHSGVSGTHAHNHQNHHVKKNANQANVSSGTNLANQFNNNNNIKLNATESLKDLVGISSSSHMLTNDSTTTTIAPTNKIQQQPQHHQQSQQQHHQQQHHHQQQQQQQQRQPQQQRQQQPQLQRANIHGVTRQQRSARIPESAVEMPTEFQFSSLDYQFGEMDLADSGVSGSEAKGAFQDVLESNRVNRQSGMTNSHSTIPSQDSKSNRQIPQHVGRGNSRRPYNNSNNNDDKRMYNNNNNSNRGGRQISGNQRNFNQRPGPTNNNPNARGGVRTILNRGLQPNSSIPSGNSNQPSGFPNSIDTWTNTTAEAATKPSNNDQAGVGNTLRVGQWSDVAGTEDWSEEDWEAKVMETKVFTPSSKPVDGPISAGQKNQALITDSSVPTQINLASKLSENVRGDLGAQQGSLASATQAGQTQPPSQKPIQHMNDIFDKPLVGLVDQQTGLAANLKQKNSIAGNQYNKDTSDAKTVLDQQTFKPKTTMSMNQYNREASESLKSLVGISSTKGNVPSVPPGALPIMGQPQYIMSNAYPQHAIFPYAYQSPDVHYQVAPPTAGREQNFQSVYSPNDASKFNRGTDGDAPAINTTQAAPVASQTHNQAFVANALHGYQLTYAMPGAFNMMPQNLYGAAPIFPHLAPTNTGTTNPVYQKNTATSYQHQHPSGYSGYDQVNPVIQDYVKQQQGYSGSGMQQQQQHQQQLQQQQQQQQQQQPTSKSSAVNSELNTLWTFRDSLGRL